VIALGALLFRSKALSSDRAIACTSCHAPDLAYSGPDAVAVGVGGTRGQRHPPSLLNLYLAKSFMLDGRLTSLDEQIHIPLEATTEMNVSWPVALSQLQSDQEIADAAVSAKLPLTRETVLGALAVYVRSLVSAASPFDRFYYEGDPQAISAQAKEGLQLFIRKGRCSSCHLITGYAAPLTDGSFHAIGIGFENGTYRDVGRYAVTGKLPHVSSSASEAARA
jgi:cytochrome c peroxidase